MLWLKSLVIFVLFYFFAILQNSFFIFFNPWGAIPNLVFIFFFLLVFFNDENKYYYIIFCSLIAGLCLDVFSDAYFGISVLLLIIIGFLIKKTQSSLVDLGDSHPISYFLPIFLVSFIVYDLLLKAYFYFLNPSHIVSDFGLSFFVSIIYNFIIAIIAFLAYKKFIESKK